LSFFEFAKYTIQLRKRVGSVTKRVKAPFLWQPGNCVITITWSKFSSHMLLRLMHP